jgi:hypothetical protein
LTENAPIAFSRRRCESASSSVSISALNEPAAPYRIVPVENVRGDRIAPALASSAAAKIEFVSFYGSWIVVTP